MNYIYCRCSTNSQENDRQKLVLSQLKVDIEQTFEEKISGTIKASKRHEFERMLEVLKEGDTIYF